MSMRHRTPPMIAFVLAAVMGGCASSHTSSGPPERFRTVEKPTDQPSLSEIGVDDSIYRAAVEKLTDQAGAISLAHRERIVSALMPAIRVLSDPRVVQQVGEIRSIEIHWRQIRSDPYYYVSTWEPAGKMIGEVCTCSIKLEKMWTRLSCTWATKFPHEASTLEWYSAEVDAADILGRLFKRLPQSLVATVALHSEDQSVRRAAFRAAFKELTDQALLAKIALEDKGARVRETAVRKLTDQALLAKIALEDKDAWVRQTAVEKLTDQALLAKIALEDKAEWARQAAVKKLTDQALLAKIALEDKDAWVRDDAARKLSDQALLAKIAVEDKEPRVREAAVRKLSDQALLAKIALEDKEPYVRQAAEARLRQIR